MRSARRPELSESLTSEEFRAWYWLKEELVDFARHCSISTTGLKREIEARIADHLAGATPSRRTASPKRSGRMPGEFTLDTVIGEGWRCGPALGRFFRSDLGSGFRFNAAMREFIHHGHGRTLADAAACYRSSVSPRREPNEIPEQLEYNRHFREYFSANPGATREQAIAAWWAKRGGRRDRIDVEAD